MRAGLAGVTPDSLSLQDDVWLERPKMGTKILALPVHICNVGDSLLPERLHPACHLGCLSFYLGHHREASLSSS